MGNDPAAMRAVFSAVLDCWVGFGACGACAERIPNAIRKALIVFMLFSLFLFEWGNYSELGEFLRSRAEYLFSRVSSFAAALGGRTPEVTMSRFSSFFP